MGFEDLFVRFWWLIFPIFGMFWALVEMAQSGRRSKQAMDIIKSLVEQGKEPPAELLNIASHDSYSTRRSRRHTPASGVITFTALAVAFGFASKYAHSQNTQEIFFALAAMFAVFALGYFLMALFGPGPEK